jgi:long-subunit acyl-CoA synthetase (AMP-forming)
VAASLADFFEENCRRNGDRLALGLLLHGEWIWVAYAELLRMVYGVRGGLAGLGVGPGDAVAAVGDNGLEWALACYAAAGRGAVFVAVAPADGGALARVLADARARVAIAPNAEVMAALDAVRADVPTLAHVLGAHLRKTDPRSLDALVELGLRRPVDAVTCAPGDPATVVYAPGGRSVATHAELVAAATVARERLRLEPDDRAVTLLPWSRPLGDLWELHALLAAGCSLAVHPAGRDPLASIRAVAPTLLVAPPATLDALYEACAPGARRARPGLVERLIRRRDPAPARAALGGRLRTVITTPATVRAETAAFLAAEGVRLVDARGLVPVGAGRGAPSQMTIGVDSPSG